MHDFHNSNLVNPNFRLYRKHAGLTVGDVAVLLGCGCYETITRIEKNNTRAGVDIIIGYHLLFDVPPEALLHSDYVVLNEGLKMRAEIRLKELRRLPMTDSLIARIEFLESITK